MLHWLIFLLIVVQFLAHEQIVAAWEKIVQDLPYDAHPLIAVHVFAGLITLGLVVWRVVLRLTRGAPSLPAEEPAPLKLAAHATHLGLYGVMFFLPITGAAAWFGGIEAAAGAHDLLKTLFLLLFAVHVLGALFQQFVLKTNIFARMKG